MKKRLRSGYTKYCCWCGGIFKHTVTDVDIVEIQVTLEKFPNRLQRPTKFSGRKVKDGICGDCKTTLLNNSKSGAD